MATRGGFRVGAGRPRKGNEPTKAIRLPLSVIERLQSSHQLNTLPQGIPFYSSKVQAGFPSPADDYIEKYLDLNTQFIKHPAATFVLQATGDSMTGAGIQSGDYLLVDRSIEPIDGKIVIAAINGELTVKRLSKKAGRIQLLAENPHFRPIDIKEDFDLIIWGVVILVMHELP